MNWITSEQKIKLVFLSLINPNKNLHLAIEAVNSLDALYSLDIYGPVIDKAYWNKCASAIKNGSNINYHGPIPPWEVPAILGQSHFLILPTQGENFGHAIFDALSIGTPVITTRHTPWQNLDSSHAGFYIDLENPDSIKDTLERIAILLPHEYESYRSGSITYARQYLANKNYRAEYNFLLQ